MVVRACAAFAALALLTADAAAAQEAGTPGTSSTTSTTVAAPPAAPPPEELDGEDAQPAEDVPTDPVVVPPPDAPPPPDPVHELVKRFATIGLKEARRQLAEAEAARAAAEAQLTAWQSTVQTLEQRLGALRGEEAAALERLQAARLRARRRAVAGYMGASTAPANSLLQVRDLNDFGRWLRFAKSVVEADRDRAEEYAAAQAAVRDEVARTVVELDRARTELAVAGATLLGADAALVAKQVQAAAAKAGGTAAAAGFTFPVGGPHSYSDTFGAARMFGTPYAHLHQGTDIFAASGTPLLACERGVVTRMGTDRLGGTKLWIVGASGTRYYYAHLSAFAPGLVDGAVVNPGDVVGFVGNTGNALTTPAHLHFEVHPDGGPAINPYPLLRAFDDAATAARR